MKTTSSSAERSALPRDLGILDTLVLMLAVALFAAWILGTLFLYLFPSETSTTTGSSAVALVDSAVDSPDISTDDPAADTQDFSSGTAAANNSDSPNAASASGAALNANQAETGDDLTAKEKTTLERKINTLQRQLDTKSTELTQLRKSSAKPNSKPTVDTSKFEKQISQLKREKSQLDREVKKLKSLSDNQKSQIKTLQGQLFDVAKSSPVAAGGNSLNTKDSSVALDGTPSENQPLEFRDWVSSKGNKARLAFVRWEDNDIIVINESNKTFRLTVNRLSPEDQKYVNSKR